MNSCTILVAAASCTAAMHALAQPTTLTFDPTSSVDADACVNSTFGTQCDSDSTGLAGTVEIELDSYTTPAQITLHDLQMNTTTDLHYTFSFGFFGSVDATLTGFNATYATPGTPTGPTAVDGAGAFNFATVTVNLAGSVDYTSSGAIGLVVGSGTSNLADLGPQTGSLSGTVTVSGSTVTAISSLDFSTNVPVADGVDADIIVSATVIANGPVPDPPCPADWNGDTFVNTSDFIAYLNDYNAVVAGGTFTHNDPDLAPPIGVVNTSDFIAFLNIFNAGCP